MIQSYLNLLTGFANGVIMPVFIGLAFVYSIWNIFQLYIVRASEDIKTRKSAVAFGIAAVVVLLTFWGAVNWLTRAVGANQNQVITPDYIKK